MAKDDLKALFVTGNKPSGSDFETLINAGALDTDIQIANGNVMGLYDKLIEAGNIFPGGYSISPASDPPTTCALGSDGWYSVTVDGTSITADAYPQLMWLNQDNYPYMLEPSCDYTIIFKVRNIIGSGYYSWVLGLTKSFETNPNSGNPATEGESRVLVTTLDTLDGSAVQSRVSAGTTISFDFQIQIVKGDYSNVPSVTSFTQGSVDENG